jgi:hypothetical protein
MERGTNHVYRRRNGRIDPRHRFGCRFHEEMKPAGLDAIFVVINEGADSRNHRSFGVKAANRSEQTDVNACGAREAPVSS